MLHELISWCFLLHYTCAGRMQSPSPAVRLKYPGSPHYTKKVCKCRLFNGLLRQLMSQYSAKNIITSFMGRCQDFSMIFRQFLEVFRSLEYIMCTYKYLFYMLINGILTEKAPFSISESGAIALINILCPVHPCRKCQTNLRDICDKL